MIPSRVTAVPIDGGDRVTGWYACINGVNHLIFTGETVAPRPAPYPWDSEDDFVRIEVDPATIEPVRVAPVDAGQRGYMCPSCGVSFVYTERMGGEWLNATPYCGNCGQALDWDKAQD